MRTATATPEQPSKGPKPENLRAEARAMNGKAARYAATTIFAGIIAIKTGEAISLVSTLVVTYTGGVACEEALNSAGISRRAAALEATQVQSSGSGES